jgi:hypothetical protein
MSPKKQKNAKMFFYWVAETCNLEQIYRRFRDACRIYRWGDVYATGTSQVTAIFILATVRT